MGYTNFKKRKKDVRGNRKKPRQVKKKMDLGRIGKIKRAAKTHP